MAHQNNLGALSNYYGDGYLSQGNFAEGKKQDGRKLTKEETTQRLQQGMSLGEWRKMVDSNGDMREPYRSQQIAAIQRGEGTLAPENGTPKKGNGSNSWIDRMSQHLPYDLGGSNNRGVLENQAQQPTAPTTHTMPDGTVMEGATHEAYEQANPPPKPALDLQDGYGNLGAEFGDPLVPGQEGYVAPVRDGIPMDQSGQQQAPPAPPQNDSRALEIAKQKQRISLGEAMGRYGGAIMNAGSRGGMAQVGAMGTVTGQIGDKNREMEQQQFDNDLALYRSQQTTGKTKGADKSSGEIADNMESVAHLDYLINRLDEAGDNVTGPKDGTYGALKDNLSGHPRATLRLQLSQVRVSAALKNVAETKGAISNREMDLFLSPMPKIGLHQEEVWKDWLRMQSSLGKILNNRLKGEQLSDGTMASKIALDRELEGELAAYYAKYSKDGAWSFGGESVGSTEADDVAAKYL